MVRRLGRISGSTTCRAIVADVDTATPNLYYEHVDHLNRPIEMTDISKNVVWKAVYWPYGEIYSITGSVSNNLPTLRDEKLNQLFGRPDESGSWIISSDRFLVTAAHQTKFGDVSLDMFSGHAIRLFPTATRAEAWRLLVPVGDSSYLIFPANLAD